MSVENPNEQDQIEAGARVESFVQDSVIQSIIARLASENYAAFKQAENENERLIAQAKGVVLDEFMTALQGVIDVGAGAKIQRKERELREARQNEGKTRVKPV